MNISKVILTYSATADDFDSVETTLQNLLAEAENNCYSRDFETSFKYLNHTITHNPYDNRFLVVLVVEETTQVEREYWRNKMTEIMGELK